MRISEFEWEAGNAVHLALRCGIETKAAGKPDSIHIPAPRKIAPMKSIPCQTLIRQRLAEAGRKELLLKS